MVNEMQPIRRLRECGHPEDCVWFWKDENGGIHVFCVPCLAEIAQRMGMKIYYYRNEEEFVRAIGGKPR